MAGAAIMAALVAAVRKTPSIRMLEGVVATMLLADGRVTGIARAAARGDPADRLPGARRRARHRRHRPPLRRHHQPARSRGAGAGGMAARAGAVIADPEFVQFHPTALDVGRDPAPLATEALRGEGATLINAAGERFMLKLHPAAELAPRDVVARAVLAEIAAGRGAFLDCARRSARISPNDSRPSSPPAARPASTR